MDIISNNISRKRNTVTIINNYSLTDISQLHQPNDMARVNFPTEENIADNTQVLCEPNKSKYVQVDPDQVVQQPRYQQSTTPGSAN